MVKRSGKNEMINNRLKLAGSKLDWVKGFVL